MNASVPIPAFEVKVVPDLNLSSEEMQDLLAKIHEIADEMGMVVHDDQITYSKKPPYKELSDIPAGVKFYAKMERFRPYLAALEYYSYTEGDINGRVLRREQVSRGRFS